ncbi:hypothetical protein NQ318_012752 [Aromia moschata]|uniref:Uncharacterized protein n=1 Tax=Aromia moschata TaxID=1265417 RepID=A0AAV8X339_9CUCU|nr:hypothetical protein NQ318_012752 [Aromia moschata]
MCHTERFPVVSVSSYVQGDSNHNNLRDNERTYEFRCQFSSKLFGSVGYYVIPSPDFIMLSAILSGHPCIVGRRQVSGGLDPAAGNQNREESNFLTYHPTRLHGRSLRSWGY